MNNGFVLNPLGMMCELSELGYWDFINSAKRHEIGYVVEDGHSPTAYVLPPAVKEYYNFAGSSLPINIEDIQPTELRDGLKPHLDVHGCIHITSMISDGIHTDRVQQILKSTPPSMFIQKEES